MVLRGIKNSSCSIGTDEVSVSDQQRPSRSCRQITGVQLTAFIGRWRLTSQGRVTCPTKPANAYTSDQVCNSETVLEEGERPQYQRWQEMSSYGNVLASPLHNKERKKRRSVRNVFVRCLASTFNFMHTAPTDRWRSRRSWDSSSSLIVVPRFLSYFLRFLGLQTWLSIFSRIFYKILSTYF